jgi:mannosyltransferase
MESMQPPVIAQDLLRKDEKKRSDVAWDISPRAALGWFLLILAVGLLLRVVALSKESLWVDEVASWYFASDLHRALTAERTNPPLYYTMLYFWMRWFGTSEAAMRSLSVVPSMLSIGLIYSLGKKLLSRRIALIAALYMCVSSFHIFYAQEARAFATLTCFLLIHTLALWYALETPGKKRLLYYAISALAGGAALYLHFIALFFISGLGLFVLLRKRGQLLNFIISSAVAFGLFLPWLTTMFKAASGGGQHRRYLFLKLPQAYFSFLFGDTLIPLDGEAVTHIRQTLVHFAPALLAGMLSLGLMLPFLLRAWKRWGDALTFVLIGATVPVLLAFIVSFKVMLFDERYLIAASPFIYIAIATSVVEVWDSRSSVPGWQRLAGFSAVCVYSVLLLVSLGNYYFNPRFGKEQWREAMAYVEQPRSGKTILIFDPTFLRFNYDYYQKLHLPYAEIDSRVEQGPGFPARIQGLVAGYDSVWLVRSHSDNSSGLNILEANMTEDDHREFPKAEGIDLWHFRVGAKRP